MIVIADTVFESSLFGRARRFSRTQVTSIARVSAEFGSKDRSRNGILGISPAQKMGREPPKERFIAA